MDNNAKGEDQKQETSIQRLKKQYPGLNVASGRFGHKKIGVNRFVVQEADGLRFVEEKDNAFVLIQKVSWSELPQRLYMDKLFMKAFYYTDEKEEHSVFTISRTDDGDAICAEVQKRKQVTVKKRKAIQRIVGFRSGSIWKSAIAVSVYAFMLFFVIGLFVGNDDEAVAKLAPVKEEKNVKSIEKKENEQIAESKKSKSSSTSFYQEPKKDSIKQLYKKLGNGFIFETTQVDKSGSALNASHHTINMRVSTTMGTAKQIRSQAQYLAAQILKESFKKDKKLDQLVLFVDYDKDLRIVKYVFDKTSLDLIKESRTSDGDVLKEHVEQYANSKSIPPDAKPMTEKSEDKPSEDSQKDTQTFEENDVYGKFNDPNAIETVEDTYKNEEENKMYVTADGEVFQTIKYFDDLELKLLPTVDFEFLINHAKDSMPNDAVLSKTLKENKEFLYHSNQTKKDYIVTFGLSDENNVTSVYVTQDYQK